MKFKLTLLHPFYFIILLFGGAFLLATTIFWIEIKGMVFQDWIVYQQTKGDVTKSTIGSRYRFPNSKEFADIEYTYAVSGKLYLSKTINFSDDMSNVERYLQKYPLGAVVTVYYDQNNASFSVLEPENKNYWIMLRPLIVLLVFLIFILRCTVCTRYRWCSKLMNWYDRL